MFYWVGLIKISFIVKSLLNILGLRAYGSDIVIDMSIPGRHFEYNT